MLPSPIKEDLKHTQKSATELSEIMNVTQVFVHICASVVEFKTPNCSLVDASVPRFRSSGVGRAGVCIYLTHFYYFLYYLLHSPLKFDSADFEL